MTISLSQEEREYITKIAKQNSIKVKILKDTYIQIMKANFYQDIKDSVNDAIDSQG